MRMWTIMAGAASPTEGLTGIVGFAARAIDTLGEWGVGGFTLAETVVPPIPSEVILPLAGYLAKQGSLNLFLVFATSTLGAYLERCCSTGLGPDSAWNGPSGGSPDCRWWTGKTLSRRQAGSAGTAGPPSFSAACCRECAA